MLAAVVGFVPLDVGQFAEDLGLDLGDPVVEESVFLCNDLSTFAHRIEYQFIPFIRH